MQKMPKLAKPLVKVDIGSRCRIKVSAQGVIGEWGSYFVVFELPGFRNYLMEKCGPLR